MGACNLLCGIAVGISGSNAALADAADPCKFLARSLNPRVEMGWGGLCIGLDWHRRWAEEI